MRELVANAEFEPPYVQDLKLRWVSDMSMYVYYAYSLKCRGMLKKILVVFIT